MKTFATLAAVIASLGLTTGTARADHDVDELANTLDRQTEQIARTIYRHFRHAPNFRHLYLDAYELHEMAHHLHDIAHHGTTYDHMRGDMQEFDRRFAHFLETVHELDDHAPLPSPHGVGSHGHFFGHASHVDPRAVSRLGALVDQTAETVSCLKAEICPPVIHQPLPAPATVVPVVPSRVTPVDRFPGAGRPIFRARKGGLSFSLRLGQ